MVIVIICYRVYTIIKEGAMKYKIPLPALFEQDAIDRTTLVYFNTNEEVWVMGTNFLNIAWITDGE